MSERKIEKCSSYQSSSENEQSSNGKGNDESLIYQSKKDKEVASKSPYKRQWQNEFQYKTRYENRSTIICSNDSRIEHK